MATKYRIAFVVLSLVLVAGAATGDETKLKVWVSIPPQAFFVARIGGDLVDVQVMVKPGHSPATYEPTPRQMAGLATADAFFLVGVAFEKGLLPKVAEVIPELRIIDGVEGIPLQPMSADEVGGGAGHGHSHHHRGLPDPHFWLDPLLVKIHAETICRALIALAPAHETTLRENLRVFTGALDDLHARLRSRLAGLEGHEIFVFHPAYGYLARRYGLRQVAVEIRGNRPSARQLAARAERAKTSRVRAIFVQPQFSTASAQVVAEAFGGKVVALDPLATDYLRNMEEMAAQIVAATEP